MKICVFNFKIQNGTDFMIDLFDLETILSPTLFLLPGRGAVLKPIRASYADDLFGIAAQGSLLPSHRPPFSTKELTSARCETSDCL